jgi:outer membrane protein assembly factor BamA
MSDCGFRIMKLPVLLTVLVLVAVPVCAQEPLDGRTILAVRVSGLVHIEEAFVLAQIESAPGQAYRKATADRDRTRLDRLGVFGEILFAARASTDGVQIDVAVTETLGILPSVAVAVTDENGASAGPAMKILSIGGRPHEMSATARFGGEKLVEFNEVSPLLRDRRLWHSIRVSGRDRFNKLDQFDERSVDLDGRIGLRASELWKSGAIFQIYRVSSDQPGITLSPDSHDTFVSFGGVTEYDTRDSWREPTRGWWNSGDVLWRTGAGQYATFDLDVRRYQPVAPRQTIVATTLLTLQSGTHGVDVPTYADYALGGENTVRGRDFGSRHGKNQFINSLEYRYTAVPTRSFRVFGVNLYAGLAVAAFGDLGTAWDDRDDFSDFIGGGGIGLRLYVPYVNMIRLDLSFGRGVHGQLGINEKAVAQRNRVR